MRVARLLISFLSMNSIHYYTKMRNSKRKISSFGSAILQHHGLLGLALDVDWPKFWRNVSLLVVYQAEVQKGICNSLLSCVLQEIICNLTEGYLRDHQAEKWYHLSNLHETGSLAIGY